VPQRTSNGIVNSPPSAGGRCASSPAAVTVRPVAIDPNPFCVGAMAWCRRASIRSSSWLTLAA
jgi:hypothetical protein